MSSPHHDLILSVSGCRGIVGETLTPETIVHFAATLADHLRAERGTARPTLVVGRDGRRGGDVLKRLAVNTLVACGCRVIDVGVATTPTMGVMILHHEADGGLTITASHNPGEWNGMKALTAAGAAPLPEEAARLIRRFRTDQPSWAGVSDFGERIVDDTAAHVHVARVLEAIEPLCPIESIKARHFRVVLDSLNASGSPGGRLLLDALGCELIHLNADDSGIFPHGAEPTRENLAGLCSAITAHKADIGFAQDPDADRLAMIDEQGRYIGEEYTLAIGIDAILSGRPGANDCVAANLSTSRMIDDVAARHGARVLRTPVGEANLVAAMLSAGCIAGGEGNGGVIWPRVVSVRDSLAAMALALVLMTRRDASLSRLVADIPAYAIEKRKMSIREGLAARAIDAVRQTWRDADHDEQDGLRVDFTTDRGKAWLHVRSSNTEPILRLIAEAPTAAAANEILDRAAAAIGD
ncbi:MAG: hypothetical protein KDA21_10265 [Phycisphaerales bacterium]|nr:hypothetical protein [Phycisphaerales bacterium]